MKLIKSQIVYAPFNLVIWFKYFSIEFIHLFMIIEFLLHSNNRMETRWLLFSQKLISSDLRQKKVGNRNFERQLNFRHKINFLYKFERIELNESIAYIFFFITKIDLFCLWAFRFERDFKSFFERFYAKTCLTIVPFSLLFHEKIFLFLFFPIINFH